MTHKQELNFRQSVHDGDKKEKRGGMKKNCSSPEILGKRPDRQPSSTYLFRLDTLCQLGERERERLAIVAIVECTTRAQGFPQVFAF